MSLSPWICPPCALFSHFPNLHKRLITEHRCLAWSARTRQHQTGLQERFSWHGEQAGKLMWSRCTWASFVKLRENDTVRCTEALSNTQSCSKQSSYPDMDMYTFAFRYFTKMTWQMWRCGSGCTFVFTFKWLTQCITQNQRREEKKRQKLLQRTLYSKNSAK